MELALALLSGVGGHAAALKYVSLAAEIIRAGINTVQKLRDLDDQIGRIVAENRAPTDAEWADLEVRAAAAHDRIQAAGDAARKVS